MKKLVAIALAATLTGCGFWPAGEDPNGRALLERANVVLAAVNNYTSTRGSPPESLQQLVPEFLPAIPVEPEINYYSKHKDLSFHYSPTLGMGRCAWSAKVGDTSFACGPCYL